MSDSWVISQKEELRSDFLKLVLYELNNAICPKEKRMAALQAAIEEFNHDNSHKHDQELELQADKILYQKIAYCFSVHKHDEEMGLIACALEMVYRANRGRVALSFQEIGDSILPLFVEMIRWGGARRKDIRTNELIEAQAKAERLMTSEAVHNGGVSVGPSVAASGIYYTGANANGHGNTASKGGGRNSPVSLVSILKTESLENEHPLMLSNRSNKYAHELSPIKETDSRLPDNLSEDMPVETGFTIECIPNGTETSAFAEVDQKNGVNDVENSKKLSSEPQDSSTESTSTCEDADLGKDSQSPNTPSPELQSRQRERQVRFSDLVDTNLKMPIRPVSKAVDSHYKNVIVDTPGSVQQMELSSQSAIEPGKPLKKEKYTHPIAVLKILKVLRYFSRVLSAMVPMAQFPGLLDELIFQMKIRKVGNDGPDGILRTKQGMEKDDDSHSFHSAKSNESEIEIGDDRQNKNRKRRNSQYLNNASVARMDAIATIVNLACAEENKTKLLEHPGLLDAVIHVAQNDPIDDAREHASIVLMNLALADDNKVAMANHFDLLQVITKLMTDDVVNTRRYASSTVLNLVSKPENINPITKFGKGHLLHVLTRVISIDEVEEIRINVSETFFNLVRNSTDLVSIELIGRHRDVLPSLATTVLSDYSADVRAYAARTLEWLAADIHFGSKSHSALLEALIKASMWTKTNCIVEAMKAQASIEENRIAMVQQKGMLDALASLSSLHGVNDEEVRECALAAIEGLTCEPCVRKTMAEHEGIMMELTRATFSSNGILDHYEENDGTTRALMKSALKNLANEI